MDSMTLEELLVEMEIDATGETIDAAMASAIEAEMQLAILATEALGSIRVLERLGWFRFRDLPENFARTLMLLAPASRGGENRTMMAERIWEGHIDRLTEVFGYEVIDRLRVKCEELFANADSLATGPQQQTQQGGSSEAGTPETNQEQRNRMTSAAQGAGPEPQDAKL